MTFEEYWGKEKQNIKFDGYISTTNKDDYPSKIIFESVGYVNADHLKDIVSKAYCAGKNIEFDSDWVVVVKGVYKGKIGRIVSVRWNCCCDIEAEAEINIVTDEGYKVTVTDKEIRRMDKLYDKMY